MFARPRRTSDGPSCHGLWKRAATPNNSPRCGCHKHCPTNHATRCRRGIPRQWRLNARNRAGGRSTDQALLPLPGFRFFPAVPRLGINHKERRRHQTDTGLVSALFECFAVNPGIFRWFERKEMPSALRPRLSRLSAFALPAFRVTPELGFGRALIPYFVVAGPPPRVSCTHARSMSAASFRRTRSSSRSAPPPKARRARENAPGAPTLSGSHGAREHDGTRQVSRRTARHPSASAAKSRSCGHHGPEIRTATFPEVHRVEGRSFRLTETGIPPSGAAAPEIRLRGRRQLHDLGRTSRSATPCWSTTSWTPILSTQPAITCGVPPRGCSAAVAHVCVVCHLALLGCCTSRWRRCSSGCPGWSSRGWPRIRLIFRSRRSCGAMAELAHASRPARGLRNRNASSVVATTGSAAAVDSGLVHHGLPLPARSPTLTGIRDDARDRQREREAAPRTQVAMPSSIARVDQHTIACRRPPCPMLSVSTPAAMHHRASASLRAAAGTRSCAEPNRTRCAIESRSSPF